MRIHRVVLNDFRGVGSADIRFAVDGVTIVQGPNEVGKTSIADAIDMLINDPDSSGKSRIKGAQPVGRDVGPRVQMEFETGPYRLTYAKQWIRGASTELTIDAPVHEQLTGRAAHDRVEAILAETVDVALFAALRQQQGVSLDQADLGASDSLGRALDRASGGDLAGDDPGGALIDAIDRERLEWSTPTGAANRARTDLRDAAAAAREEAEGQRAALDALDARADDHRRLMREIEANAAAEPDMRARLDARESELATVGAREALVRELDQDAGLAEAAAAAARQSRATRAALITAVTAGEERLDAIAHEAQRDGVRMGEALTRRDEAAALLTDAVEVARTGEASFITASRDAQHLRDVLDLELMGERRDRVRAAEVEIAEADAVAGGPGPDARLMDLIERANLDEAVARGRVEGAGARLRVDADSAQEVLANGAVHRLGPGDHVVIDINAGDALEVTGVVRITPEGTGDADRDALRSAARNLAGLLVQAGVPAGAGVDGARSMFRAREDAGRRAAAAREARTQALRDLTVEEMADKLVRGRDRVARYGAGRPAGVAVPGSIDDANAARARAEDARDAARRAEDAARQSHAAADAAVRNLQAEASERTGRLGAETARLDADRGALEAARAATPDDALAAEEDRATAQAHGARERHHGEAAALAADDPEMVRAQVTNQRGALDRLVRERNEMALLAERMAGEISQQGDEGLADRAALADERAAAAEDDLARAEARASAADLLHEVMTRHRDLARRSYVAPFRDEVERLARLVFGGGTSVAIDHASLRVVSRTRGGVTVPYEALSGGAREQLAIIGRLAAATLAAPSGGAPVIIDDALGYSDAGRLQGVATALAAAGTSCQVIVLTCVPDRYSGIGQATVVRMDSTPAPGGAPPAGLQG